MNYALFEHNQNNLGLVNIGDHIQSCAAEQFLPRVDFFVERDRLNAPQYGEAKIIMNGWFTDAPENWPPNPRLIPLFVSFHLQPKSAQILFSKSENVEYLKAHAPIGCRDYRTMELLQAYGIEAYFSFCLTTTLDEKFKSEERDDNFYFVDPLYAYDRGLLKKIDLGKLIRDFPIRKLSKLKGLLKPKAKLTDFVPQDVIEAGIRQEHYVSANKDNIDLYSDAKNLLKKYARAKGVVTSRIHCALPCLALETPVLFVMEGLKDEKQHMSRFRGILDHINILTTQPKKELDLLFGREMNVYHPNDIDWDNLPENPKTFRPLAEELKNKCRKFIAEN